MNDNPNLSADLFLPLSDLFLDCKCGTVPDIHISFAREFCEVLYEVVCPSCGHRVSHVSQFLLDFSTLSEDWNSFIDED